MLARSASSLILGAHQIRETFRLPMIIRWPIIWLVHLWRYLPGSIQTSNVAKEGNNTYYFFPANQQKANCKIYSLTKCGLTVNGCDWHILAGNHERILVYCLTWSFLQPLKFRFLPMVMVCIIDNENGWYTNFFSIVLMTIKRAHLIMVVQTLAKTLRVIPLIPLIFSSSSPPPTPTPYS